MTDVDSDPNASADPDRDADSDPETQPPSDADAWSEAVDALGSQDGWQAEGFAARVHYRGAGDHYSVEYYAPSDCVLYWKVKGDGEVAVPVGRETVPDPLRERIRQDLGDAGVDPAVESRVV